MKATGIVRRLDDLGRLVIPKEIRRIYRLKEGDSIEFFVSEHSEIILKKYSYLNDEKEMLTRMVNTLKEVTKCEVLFLLEDEIIGNDNILPDDCTSEITHQVRQYHPTDFESMRCIQRICLSSHCRFTLARRFPSLLKTRSTKHITKSSSIHDECISCKTVRTLK